MYNSKSTEQCYVVLLLLYWFSQLYFEPEPRQSADKESQETLIYW